MMRSRSRYRPRCPARKQCTPSSLSKLITS
uniref:Uncharacterized protein n=1 Tax=Arundo donax TaxID=35708 RepID=A0A0A9EM33_ARUDO